MNQPLQLSSLLFTYDAIRYNDSYCHGTITVPYRAMHRQFFFHEKGNNVNLENCVPVIEISERYSTVPYYVTLNYFPISVIYIYLIFFLIK